MKKMANPMTAEQSRLLAERAALRRLLNAFFRENGIADPRIKPGDPRFSDLSEPVLGEALCGGEPMRVDLPFTGRFLFGTLTYFSPFGHHDYGPRFWAGFSPGAAVQSVNFREAIRLLLTELAAREPDAGSARARAEALFRQVENSAEKTALYLSRRTPLILREDILSSDCTRAAEQSLVFGHPFHPTPKSSEGFSFEDLERYAPELGAEFPLHYFAVIRQRVREERLPEIRDLPIPPEVRRAAAGLVDPDAYRLLPCHPWQASYLRKQPAVREWEAKGEIRYLGPLGNPVYPTSSVRTVCDPRNGVSFKLPLNVRITNFVRVNPLEHAERSLDAGRVIRGCPTFRTLPGFGVLLECGYRTVIPRGPEEEKLVESWTVLFREHPFSAGAAGPVVVAAALLEETVGGEQPLLLRAVRRAGGESGGTVSGSTMDRWLRRYLEISLKPLLWVFIREGVSLEAHVQNAMVRLEKGWPEGFYVRDMEGVSIGRERAEATGFYGGVLSPDSPALYPEEDAWNRLKYYFVTNHLGHLIHVLARYGGRDERELWRIAREALEDWKELRQEKRGERYVRDLLDNPRLPAKANLISRFRERGECPSYVTVANPICEVSR